jgi:hypothetical protein
MLKVQWKTGLLGILPANLPKTENSSQLIHWVNNQRAGMVRKTISRQREKLLQEIGVTSSVLEPIFDKNFQHMVNYRKTYPSHWPKHK